MQVKGLVRLWIVLSFIGVPALAEMDFQQKVAFWGTLNEHITKMCVDQEFALDTHPDALECGKQQGSLKTVFEREETTPLKYWPQVLFWSFVTDLIVTGLLVGSFFVARWVWRGFKRDLYT